MRRLPGTKKIAGGSAGRGDDGVGVEEALRRDPDLGFGMLGPEFEILDDGNRVLPWAPRGVGDAEADGEGQVQEGYLEDGPSYEGPWAFRFTL
ncbi:MAG TPA: hypothetical protein VF068_12945 [Rubrobacter sp.]